jgi:Mor family transcriptional regulator
MFEPSTVVEEYSAEWAKPSKIADFEEVARLQKQQGMTYEQLAKHFNVSLSTIYQSLRKSVHAKIVGGAP